MVQKRPYELCENCIAEHEVPEVTPKQAFDLLFHKTRTFPLQTLQSMAERWGITRQAAQDRRKNHKDFPKPIEGIVTKTAMTPTLYPLYEVEAYEARRGYTNVKPD